MAGPKAHSGTNAACSARFLRSVLSWDYFQLLAMSKESERRLKEWKRKTRGEDAEATAEEPLRKKPKQTQQTEGGAAKEEALDGEPGGEKDNGDGESWVAVREEDLPPLTKVPPKFASVDEYLAVFEPLILEECRAQIVRGQEENGATDCQMAVPTKFDRAHNFEFLEVTAQEHVVALFHDNDLVLVSREKPLEGDKLPLTYAFANVEGRDTKTTLRLRLSLESLLGLGEEGMGVGRPAKVGEEVVGPGTITKEVEDVGVGRVVKESEEGVPVGVAQSPKRWKGKECLNAACALRMRVFLSSTSSSSNSICWVLKLCNLSTITREFTALHSVRHLPFRSTVLTGAGAEPAAGDAGGAGKKWVLKQPLMQALAQAHNESQLRAIEAAMSKQPLVLIQGPPGTGKTQAILGLLSAVLNGRPPHSLENAMLQHGQARGNASLALDLSPVEKSSHRLLASPWLKGLNPRDAVAPCPCDPADVYGATQNVLNLGLRQQQRAHVLVCAPSNSALDEIVLRVLHSGLRDDTGGFYSPSIVRVGLNSHHSVSSVCMDTLVSQRLNSMDRSAVSVGAKSSGGSAGMERDRIRVNVLDTAAIVFSTLAYAGSGVFARMSRPFDVLVIDEAAQAVEPSTLIPMSHGCSQVFLVGDPLQLPATVLSTRAVDYGYNGSMFGRLQEAGYPVVMLKTQYRMHPKIRAFPSSEFYENKLEDSADVAKKTSRPWHEDVVFGPFFFFDLHQAKEEQPGGGSWQNVDEAEFVVVLYRHLVALYPQLKNTAELGVISPYKSQVKLLRSKFQALLGDAAHTIDVNTVDGFQGREKDIIIFSCVRARSADKKGRKSKGIGFLSDYRRMNVGVTRARSSMLVVGCGDVLRSNKHWGHLLAHAKSTCRHAKVVRPFHKIFSGEELEKIKSQCAAHDAAHPEEDKLDLSMLEEEGEEEGLDEEEGEKTYHDDVEGGDVDDDVDNAQDWS